MLRSTDMCLGVRAKLDDLVSSSAPEQDHLILPTNHVELQRQETTTSKWIMLIVCTQIYLEIRNPVSNLICVLTQTALHECGSPKTAH